MKTINSISFLAIFLIIFFSAISHAQGWLEYINREDLFIVNFPGKPEVRETAHRSAFEAIFPARVYTVEKDSSIYSLTVVDYREPEKIHPNETVAFQWTPLSECMEMINSGQILDAFSIIALLAYQRHRSGAAQA